ncbi:hypothetical protein DFP72DRAFT_1077512 [Ephemerocybe angulata]|uniref:F-box domain-containing protein n=1 Tax=Ephemerocybe angulata TaxID=980116 RepID=A0A8H6HFK7_9AGAR|nr:hypothetical protein DFP72DRAFT_1077512 [Tulosesus angulatus]
MKGTVSPPASYSSPMLDSVSDFPGYRRKLAHRIQDLERELAMLRSCQNAVIPAYRLPAKILSEIFPYNLAMDFEHPFDQGLYVYKKSRSMSWLRVASVCRYWREVALACPTLWSSIVMEHPYTTQTMLARSKTSSISAYYQNSSGQSDPDPAFEALSPHIGRLHSLQIFLRRECPSIRAAVEAWPSPTPTLTRLELGVSKPGITSPLPEGILSRVLPSVQRLSILGSGRSCHLGLGSRIYISEAAAPAKTQRRDAPLLENSTTS